MAGAQAFLRGWLHLLEAVGGGDLELGADPWDEDGWLIGSVAIGRGWRLEVDLQLRFADHPTLHRYSLQLLDPLNRDVLRFDNYGGHLELAGAPHHRHRLGRVEGVSPPPSLRTMLAAIQDEIESVGEPQA